MKIKTSELTGAALDWAVAKCENLNVEVDQAVILEDGDYYVPSEDWAKGGPIIEREIKTLKRDFIEGWFARSQTGKTASGSTPLIAAMRCYVASKLGDEIEIPKELL